MKPYSVALIPDIHAPLHHRAAYAATLRLLDDIQPEVVVQLGDAPDFAALAQHPKTHGVKRAFYPELKAARVALNELWDATSSANQRFMVGGNHDTNLLRYISRNAEQLEEMIEEMAGGMTIPGVLRMPKDVQYCGFNEHFIIANTLMTHAVATNLVNSKNKAGGRHIAYGHSHRAGILYSGNVEGDRHFTINCGYLADPIALQKAYARSIDTTDWQHGIGWLDVNKHGTFATFLPFVNGRYTFRGQVYR